MKIVQRIALKEICEIYDGPHATPKKITEGPIYLGIDAITSDGKIDYSQCAHLSEEDYKKWTKRVTPQQGDIVFSYEATLGRYALIPEEFYGCLGRRLAVVRNKSENINTSWLYYYFRSPEWTAFIQQQIVKGSTVNRISVEDFPEYTVPVMSIEEQNSIAEILSIIDRKIELNRLVNDNLQQQLKLLYDYWFTQFDFPDKNGQPYKSSGGQMQENNILKMQMPTNWSVINIREISNITWGQCPEGKNILPLSAVGDNLIDYCSGAGDMKGGFIVDCQAKTDDSRRYSHEKDILVSVAGKIGDMCVVDHTISLGRAAMAFTALNEDEIPYIYMTLKSLNKKMLTISSGSIQKVINNNNIDDFVFAYNRQVTKSFSNIAMPIFDELIGLAHENQALSKLRDWLLPMLMNGQATISD